MSTSPPCWRDLHPSILFLVAALTVAGGWLRAEGLHAPFTPDEFANVSPGGLWDIGADYESAVNPPLMRWLGNLFVPDSLAIPTGRWVSLLASTASLPVAFVVCLRASRSALAALAATALLAVAPVAAIMGVRFRAYGLLGLWLMLHLLALSRLAEDPEPSSRRLAMVTAVLLAWTHYLTVPLALLWIPLLQWRAIVPGAIRLWLPAAASLLPLAPLVFGITETRVATRGSMIEGLGPILSAGIPTPWVPVSLLPLYRQIPPNGMWADDPAGLWMLLPLLALPVLWGRLSATARLCALSLGALVVSVLAVGLVQYVRSPVGLVWLYLWAPVFAALLGSMGRAASAAGLLYVGLLGAGGPPQVRHMRSHAPEGALIVVMETWRDHGPPADRVWLYPGWAWTGAYLLWSGQSARHNPSPPPCDDSACFLHESQTFYAGRRRAPGQSGLFFAVEDSPSPELIEGCTEIHAQRHLRVYRCR